MREGIKVMEMMTGREIRRKKNDRPSRRVVSRDPPRLKRRVTGTRLPSTHRQTPLMLPASNSLHRYNPA
jgi:hypothetical protein